MDGISVHVLRLLVAEVISDSLVVVRLILVWVCSAPEFVDGWVDTWADDDASVVGTPESGRIVATATPTVAIAITRIETTAMSVVLAAVLLCMRRSCLFRCPFAINSFVRMPVDGIVPRWECTCVTSSIGSQVWLSSSERCYDDPVERDLEHLCLDDRSGLAW
jgi:hypothetical protein